jgi:hypothetical protein
VARDRSAPVAPALEKQAADFASTIQRALNTTICHDAKIQAVVIAKPGHVHVGHGLTKASPLETRPMPIGIGKGKPRGWMDLSYRLCLDDVGQYLTVVSSFVAVFADEDGKLCLFHVDYERDKGHGYPDAHLQVYGESAALDAWQPGQRGLHKLHFPVGGRRYRPTLEDVIEFLIAEKLAEPAAGWNQAKPPAATIFTGASFARPSAAI